MTGISAMGAPGYFSAQTYPTGSGRNWLLQQYADNFGFAQTPVYDLPVDVNMGYGYGGAGMGTGYGMGMGMGMYPQYSKAYIDYINMDYKDRLNYDHVYNQAARQFDFNETRSAQQYAALKDGQTGNIALTCRALQQAVVNGDTDQVVREFNRIVTALKGTPIYDKLKEEGAHTEKQIDLQIRNAAFEQFHAVTGQDLSEMLDANCDSSLANGFFNTLTFGNAQHYSKEEMIAKLYGAEQPHSTNGLKAVGKTGGVLTYAGTGAAIGAIVGFGLPGALIGGAIGTAAGIIGACC